MAENQMLDIATEVMINRFGLDETEYQMFTFNEGANAVSIGMTNGTTPVKVSFPKDDLQFELMKKWDLARKEAYVKNHIEHNLDFPEKVLEDTEFMQIITRVGMGLPASEDGIDIDSIRANMKAGDKLVVNLSGDGISVNEEETSEGVEIETSGDQKEAVEEKPKKKATKKKATRKKATTK
ncbi:hypothetical protein F400_gp068 [Bacillus phage BCD7]|uniref:Uncharacterized protein n=1 Tax=Bacillus phage BCD7 TaxID=1136534 RepID=J9PVB2_9CAUD|nr:hypothetical protein F400_gp068 [Bacillus phage BCD7]AEZ50515.1 hypothetical protein BCD7_0068 [Bacillus phage BCD7]